MLKKLFFVAFLTTFAIVSASAQTKVDRYLGTWKMVSQPKGSKIKMITLNVSVADEMLKVEKIVEEVRDGKDVSSTSISFWRLSGAPLTRLLSTMGDFWSTQMSYPRNGKLRFTSGTNPNQVNQDLLQFNRSTREDWSLSSDGRTLTTAIGSWKFVYAKQ